MTNRLVFMLLLPLATAFPSGALIVNGEEIEDIYAYIVEVLEEQQQAEAAYEEKVKQGVEYRGNRPYAYNALRHLSQDDLIYGAIQGGLTAVRDMGPNATPAQVAARAEANIQRVMEMFPMLANNFLAGEKLLARMKGTGRNDYMQQFLLRRCKPGIASDSLFSLYWREELIRNRRSYIGTLGEILDSPGSEPTAVELALPLYLEAAEAQYIEQFEKDPGMRQLREAQPQITSAEVFAQPELMAQLGDATAFHARTKGLVRVRQRLLAQADPAMQRAPALAESAQKMVEEFDARHPMVAGMQAEEEASASPAPIPAATDEGEMAEGAPAEEEEDAPEEAAPETPRLGIPTLSF